MEDIESVKMKLWANLQDNLRRSDIIDRCRDEMHRELIMENYRRTEQEIARLRKTLKKMEG